MKAEEYSLGFAFDKKLNYVALIEKQRPKWQKGKLNGIGGHIEKNETPEMCMIREFEEETGYKTNVNQWTKFLIMRFPDAVVFCYYKILPLEKLKSKTDEKIWLFAINDIKFTNDMIIPNLCWIIPMALKYKDEPFDHLDVLHHFKNT